MDDEKVYTPEVIDDQPFPVADVVPLTDTQTSGNDTFGQKTIQAQPLPTRKVAHDLIGQALNTKTLKILQAFELIQQGAIQIGKYENGVSGDVRITPNGITARDLAGLITFVLDGTTGDATFRGTVQTGSLIAGLLAVGDNSIVIDGESRRMVWYDENGIPVIVIGNI